MLDFTYRDGIPAIGFTVLTGALFLAFFVYAIVFMVKRRYPRNAWDIVFRIFNWILIVATAYFLVALFLPEFIIFAIIFDMPLFEIAVGEIMGFALTGGTLFAMLLCAILHIAKTRKMTKEEKELILEKKKAKKLVKNAVEKGQYITLPDIDTTIEQEKNNAIKMVGETDKIGKTGEQFSREFLQNFNDEDELEPIEYGEKTMQSIEEVESLMRNLNREQGAVVAANGKLRMMNYESLSKEDDNGSIDKVPNTYDSIRAKVFDEVREFSKTVEMIDDDDEKTANKEQRTGNDGTTSVANDELLSDSRGGMVSPESTIVDQDNPNTTGEFAVGAITDRPPSVDKALENDESVGYDNSSDINNRDTSDNIEALAEQQEPLAASQTETQGFNITHSSSLIQTTPLPKEEKSQYFIPNQRRIVLSNHYVQTLTEQKARYEQHRAQRVKAVIDKEQTVGATSTRSNATIKASHKMQSTAKPSAKVTTAKKPTASTAKPATKPAVKATTQKPVVTSTAKASQATPPVKIISQPKADDAKKKAAIKQLEEKVAASKKATAKKPTAKKPATKTASNTPLFSDKKPTKKPAVAQAPKDTSIGKIPQIKEDMPYGTESRKYVIVNRGSASNLFDEYLAKKNKKQLEKLQQSMSSVVVDDN